MPCGRHLVKARSLQGSFLGRAQPLLGGFLGLGLFLGGSLGQKLVEHQVPLSGGFGDDVPFQTFQPVICIGAERQYPGEAVLGDRAVLFGGFAEQGDGPASFLGVPVPL